MRSKCGGLQMRSNRKSRWRRWSRRSSSRRSSSRRSSSWTALAEAADTCIPRRREPDGGRVCVPLVHFVARANRL